MAVITRWCQTLTPLATQHTAGSSAEWCLVMTPTVKSLVAMGKRSRTFRLAVLMGGGAKTFVLGIL